MPSQIDDIEIRLTALQYADRIRSRWGDHVPAAELQRGFDFRGEPIRLVGPGMGIFKPKQLRDGPITIRTSLASSYSDEPLTTGDGIRYDFAPPAREYDNDGMKRLCDLGRPLIYLIQVAPKSQGSEYAIVSPVFVRGWNEAARSFFVSLRPSNWVAPAEGSSLVKDATANSLDARYRTVELQARLHQAHFRRAVLQAYRHRCTVCELRIRPLLEAAHIRADAKAGHPTIDNGLGLCVLHHRAFDRDVLRVTPDYTVRINFDAIRNGDRFAVQALSHYEGQPISLPKREDQRPSRTLLEERISG